MKSTPIFKILEIILLIGIVLYFVVQGTAYFSDTMRQNETYESISEDTISLNGWLIREEEVFSSSEGALSHTQQEGAKVGRGQTVAEIYESRDALNASVRLQELELQKQQLEFAQSCFLDTNAVLKLDSTIQGEILSLRQNICTGDYNVASHVLAALKGAVLKRDNSYQSQDTIEQALSQIKAETTQLQQSLSKTEVIIAPQSGIFSATCDGYETVLTKQSLSDLTANMLKKVEPVPNADAVGKMIYGDTWYYAAVLSSQEADRLKGRSTVTLRFAKGVNLDIKMDIVRLTKENGESLLILSCNKYLPETTLLRYQAADIILDSYSGLRINANALRVDEEGTPGVYCVIGATARFKPVDVVYEGEGYLLVRPAESALADPTGVSTLRSGDQVITSAGELFNGKVIS